MATVYRKGDAGAPALAYTTVQATIANFAALKVLLIACLVNGYSGKPAAGWALVAEGTNYLVLRNATHSGYVCLSWLNNYGIVIHVAETFTGVTNNVMTGAGLKTGLAANNATPHRLELTWLVHSSANTSWYIVADGKSFIFGGAGVGTNEPLDTNTYSMKPLYVGEDSQGNYLAVGGYLSVTDAINSPNYFHAQSMTVLKDPATGLLVDSAAFSPLMPAMFAFNSVWKLGQPLPLTEVSFDRVAWGKSGSPAMAGYLRGVAVSAALSMMNISAAIASLGGPATTYLSGLHNSIPLGDGYTYLPGAVRALNSTFFATDNPEFW